MIASFNPNTLPGATILRPCTGHAVTVNVRPGSNIRVVLIVSDRDHAKLDSNQFTVTDLMTGMVHTLKRDECGLGCKCAVTFA